jgi:transposase-like protein
MKATALIAITAGQMLAAGMNPSEAARELRKAMITQALDTHHGNVCRVARALHVHRNTLSRQMADLGISDIAKEFRTESQLQRSLKMSGLPLHSPALRKLARGGRLMEDKPERATPGERQVA